MNLFIPSAVTWKEKGAVLTQTTGAFPEEAATHLRWRLDRPGPNRAEVASSRAGARPATVRVNGTVVAQSDKPGSYIEVDRMWRDGDVVDRRAADGGCRRAAAVAPDIVAFTYGPVVLAGALGGESCAEAPTSSSTNANMATIWIRRSRCRPSPETRKPSRTR